MDQIHRGGVLHVHHGRHDHRDHLFYRDRHVHDRHGHLPFYHGHHDRGRRDHLLFYHGRHDRHVRDHHDHQKYFFL